MFKNNAALLALKAQLTTDTPADAALAIAEPSSSDRLSGRVEFLPSGAFLFTEGGDRFAVKPPLSNHCLPGDQVEVVAAEGKVSTLVRLIETKHASVIGTVRFSGSHRFIDAEDRRVKSNFFIPPALRGDEQDGDIVEARITQHPYESGRAQAVVETLIARGDDKTAIWKLALHKMRVVRDYPEFQIKEPDLGQRIDYSHLPFVTIDGESTRDMDDALYAEPLPEGGWRVWVAIADPDAYLDPGSALDMDARHRAATSYLPAMTTPMLPSELSEDLVSLMANKPRPVMLAKLTIGERGDLLAQTFELAIITSKMRLSYTAVNDYISGETGMNASVAIKESLKHLYWFSKARQQWRSDNALSQEHFDADYRLDASDWQVKRIVSEPRNDAHKLVEEAMVAANIAFACFADEHRIAVLSRVQGGFSPRSLEAVNHLASAYDTAPFSESEQGFDQTLAFLRKVAASSDLAHQLRIRATFMPSLYSTCRGFHASLGLLRYATFTSPIRKYSDLINHRQMKAYLLGQAPGEISQDEVDALNERTRASAQGEREVNRKLYAKHFSFLAAEPLQGQVVAIRSKYLDVMAAGAKFSVEVRFRAEEGRPYVENDEAQLTLIANGVERLRLGDIVSMQLDLRALEQGDLKAFVQL